MRLAGQGKGGFYPVPPEVIRAFAKHLRPPKDGNFSIIDPCCGKGAALQTLANELECRSVYGIELEEKRGQIAKQELVWANPPDDALVEIMTPADFIGTDIEAGTFSFAWVNPPYDDEPGGGQRVEYTFLSKATSIVQPGGVIALALPYKVMASNALIQRRFMTHFRDVRFMQYLEDFRDYNEVIIVGVKRTASVKDDMAPDWDEGAIHVNLEDDDWEYQLPPGPRPRRFTKTTLTMEEMLARLDASPLRAIIDVRASGAVARPPLPLTNGHKAMMLTSGLLDGIVRPEGEEPHLVRGTAVKKKYVSEQSSDTNEKTGVTTDKTVISERICLTVRVAYQDGTILTLDNGAGEEKVDEAST